MERTKSQQVSALLLASVMLASTASEAAPLAWLDLATKDNKKTAHHVIHKAGLFSKPQLVAKEAKKHSGAHLDPDRHVKGHLAMRTKTASSAA